MRRDANTSDAPGRSAGEGPLLDNQTYYFVIGNGRWRGKFSFRLTDARAFHDADLRLMDRLLARGMSMVHQLLGDSRIDSEVWADPEPAPAGLAGNTVRISKLGLTLYLLRETYTLAANGRDVDVRAHERFGPLPFLLNNSKRHPAVIHDRGMSSTYYIPLLGAEWTADYTVDAAQTHIDGLLKCPWAEATEVIDKRDAG